MKGQTADFQKYQQEKAEFISKIEQYQMIFDQAFEPFLVVDEEERIIFASQPACLLFCETKENLLYRKLSDLFTGITASPIRKNDEAPQKDQWKIQLKDGRIKAIEYKVFPAGDKGQYKFYKLKDITFESQAKQEKNMSMKMFMDMFQLAVDGIAIYDKSGIILDVNDSFCKALRVEKRQLAGKKIEAFVTEESQDNWLSGLREAAENGSVNGDVTMSGRNGECIKFDYTTSFNNLNGLCMSIFRNITERRIMEQKLVKSERITNELLEHSVDAILFSDHQDIIFRVNDSACKIFENTKEGLIGSTLFQYIYKRDQSYIDLMKQFEQEGAVRGELFFRMPNGQIKLLELTSKRHEDEGYNLTILRNVSERWRIETELRNSERKFRKVFEGSLDGMILWRSPQEFIDINEAGTKILSMPREELLSQTVDTLIDYLPENGPPLRRHLEKVFQNGSETSVIPVVFNSGRTKHLEISTRENLYSGLHLTIIRDITETLEMQEQIRKSDTLSVVGELAAGIAHEIRNPMTAMKGFIQLLQTSVKEDFSTYFHVITTELNRIETIITEFLVLAKPQAVRYCAQNIKGIMEETLELMSAQALLDNIQFKVSAEEEEFLVFCEANQLKQVFINMIKNAIEVMPDGGIIRISIAEVESGLVRITIQDEGQGIPEEKIKKLGEPFYTTKERGTGLGLMVSYKIIEEHKGFIEVESEVGVGSNFHIYLPLSQQS